MLIMNKPKRYVTRIMMTSAMVSVFGLSACVGHHNVLLTADKAKTAKFLYDAQMYASKKTNFYNMMGTTYEVCVTNPHHFDNPFAKVKTHPCDGLFNAMVEYAQKSKAYSSVTVDDLNDKAVIKRLDKELFNEAMNQGSSSADVIPHVKEVKLYSHE